MRPPHLNLLVGWAGVLMGVGSGAAIGLFFHRDEWLGGYGSFRRRMIRLGHLSFFGIGFVNILFALSIDALPLAAGAVRVASIALIIGAITMPVNCLLTAWRGEFRHLFAIPVTAVAVAVGIVCLG
jgi:hypothetical protein